MRIGIDARFLQEAGIGRYLRNLIVELDRIDHKNEYFLFLLKKDLQPLNLGANFHCVEANFGWYGLSEQQKLPGLLQKYNLDVVHFPHFNIPIFYTGKFVVTIHDLIHLDFKMKRASTHNRLFYEIKHHVHKAVLHRAVQKSEKILVPSHFVKEEIISRWRIDEQKIVVTYEAAEESFIKTVKDLTKDAANKILQNFGINPPFIFYVGNAHPHKNVDGLIKAFLQLRKKYQYLQLVLSGNDSYFWQKLKHQYNQKDIIFTGFISDTALVALYKSAQAYVFPSFSEGFGIPLLEAMACGCPVVSSHKTVLSEIGGEAAVYFDPNNLSDMADKIQEVLDDQKLRKELVSRGQKRVTEFSWEKLARQTLAVYTKSAT